MNALKYFILGALLATQSVFAIEDGTYRTSSARIIIETNVWTVEEKGNLMQLASVRQITPIVKEIPPIYILVPNELSPSDVEEGDLKLHPKKNQRIHSAYDQFVSYEVLTTTKPCFRFTQSDESAMKFCKIK